MGGELGQSLVRLRRALKRRIRRLALTPRDLLNKAWFQICQVTGLSSSLTVLANYHGSDKGTLHASAHGYTHIYSEILEAWRDQDIRLLEIGIGIEGRGAFGTTVSERNPGGASLKMWRDYFQRGLIFGVDLNDASMLDSGRLRTFVGDQGSRQDLLRVIELVDGEVDVVIDDGSHASKHQQATLDVLFPIVRPGGFYLIEDLHWQPAMIEAGDDRKTRDVLTEFAEEGVLGSEHMTPGGKTYFLEWAGSIRFWPSSGSAAKLAIIQKRTERALPR